MKKVFFLHIPKNSGSSFNQVLFRNFDKRFLVPWEVYETFTSIGQEKAFQESNLVCGHYPYGLHKLCNNQTDFIYITMLRNPISRCISAFNYLKFDSTYVNRTPELKHYLSQLSLIDFCGNEHQSIPNHRYTDNGQVRYLSGIGSSKPFGELDIDDLNIAKNNLEKMHFGITEWFDLSMAYFERTIFKKSAVYIRKRTGSRPNNGLNNEELSALNKLNQLDLQLFDFGIQLFKERTAKISGGSLCLYQARLKAYQVVFVPYLRIKQLLK